MPKRNALCHPERPHLAKGKCRACYYLEHYHAGGEEAKRKNRERMKKLRLKNHEHLLAYQREWVGKNRVRINERNAERYTLRKDEINARRRQLASPEKLAREREWHHNNPERSKAIAAAKKAKRRAAGRVSAKDVAAIYENQHGHCFWCSAFTGDNYHLDHYIPVARGGTSELENLVISCPPCNLSRGALLPEEWERRNVCNAKIEVKGEAEDAV